jgi:hypothetical protein
MVMASEDIQYIGTLRIQGPSPVDFARLRYKSRSSGAFRRVLLRAFTTGRQGAQFHAKASRQVTCKYK